MRQFTLVLLALGALMGCRPGARTHKDRGVRRNPGDWREDSTFLSAPTLHHPIYACAHTVIVSGFVPGATVEVFINGNPVPAGHTTSQLSSAVVSVGAAFVAGQKITAKQVYQGATGPASNIVPVTSYTVDYPHGIPAPLLTPTPCYACGRAVGVGNTVPGALLTLFTRNPAGGGFGPVAAIGQEADAGYVVTSAAFVQSAELFATQKLCTDVSPPSDTVIVSPAPGSVPVPIVDPVFAGLSIVTVWGPGHTPTTNGATLAVFAGAPPGTSAGGQPTPGGAGQEVGIAPPAGGPSYFATQSLCSVGAPGPSTPVRPCTDLPAAIMRPPLPGATSITLTTYTPGAEIIVFAGTQEVGRGGGPVVNLSRPLNNGEVITVIQQIGHCQSRLVDQLPATCSLGGNDQACSGDWPAYRQNGLRNGTQQNTTPLADPYHVRTLHITHTFSAPAATQPNQSNAFNAGPTVSNGRVFVPNANGHLYALDAVTLQLLWQYPAADAAPLTSVYVPTNPSGYGLASAATVTTIDGVEAVIFAAPDRSVGQHFGSGRLFALGASDGHVIWASPELARLTAANTAVGPQFGSTGELHEQFGYSSPLVLGRTVYIGIADHGDDPIQNGKVIAVSLNNGTPVPGFSFVATGTRGGGIWGSPAGGLTGSAVYVTTGNTADGNPGGEPNPNHGLSMLRLDPSTGAIGWELQPVPFTLDNDPDWAAGPALSQTACGELSASTMKDGWSYAAFGTAAAPPSASVNWQFPPTGFPFTSNTLIHGDSRYLKPGAIWNDIFFAMVGGEMLTLEPMFPDDSFGDQFNPAVLPGYHELHALMLCAKDEQRVRWIVDVPSTDTTTDYQLGPPTVTQGIVYVTTAAGHLVAIADPSTWPAQAARCSLVSVPANLCQQNGFQLVGNPTVLLDLPLNAGLSLTEPALANGRVYVTTQNGTALVLETNP